MTGPVIDVFTSIPTPARTALEIRSWGNDAGYRSMFSERWGRQLGLPAAAIEEVADLPGKDFLDRASRILEPHLPRLPEVMELLREAGIERAVVHAPLMVDVPYPNDATTELVGAAGDLLVGFARVDPSRGDAAGEEVIRGVTDLGLRGVTITPFWHGVSADDPRALPIFEAAQDVGVPVWVHTSMNWTTERPLDLEAPRHIDRVAGMFPDVPILCGHGGWPWVQEIVAVAWRHANVYLDLSAFRPKHIFAPGSGWEALVYYGARTIADRLVFGSTWGLLGRSPHEMVAEADAVPWPEPVRRAWLFTNAKTLLGEP